MLTDIQDIRAAWPGDALGLDDAVKDDTGKTAYERFVETEAARIERRLRGWVGADSYADAGSETPADPDRAAAIREAERSLVDAAMTGQMARVAVTGVEKDITLPSGTRLSIALYSREDYERTLQMFADAAYCAVAEYLV